MHILHNKVGCHPWVVAGDSLAAAMQRFWRQIQIWVRRTSNSWRVLKSCASSSSLQTVSVTSCPHLSRVRQRNIRSRIVLLVRARGRGHWEKTAAPLHCFSLSKKGNWPVCLPHFSDVIKAKAIWHTPIIWSMGKSLKARATCSFARVWMRPPTLSGGALAHFSRGQVWRQLSPDVCWLAPGSLPVKINTRYPIWTQNYNRWEGADFSQSKQTEQSKQSLALSWRQTEWEKATALKLSCLWRHEPMLQFTV